MADVTITDDNFDENVLKSSKPVLVDFWAEWCTPCKIQGPIVEEIAKEVGDTAVVGKLDVDNNQQTAQKYGIMSIPSLMIFKGGEVVKQFVGVQSKDTLLSALKAAA